MHGKEWFIGINCWLFARDISWHMTTWHVRVTLCIVPGTDRRMHAMQYSVQTLIMFANNELIKGSPVTCVWNNFKCSQFECKMQCIILIALGLNFIPWTQGLTSTPSREGSSKSEIEMFFMKLKNSVCVCSLWEGCKNTHQLGILQVSWRRSGHHCLTNSKSMPLYQFASLWMDPRMPSPRWSARWSRCRCTSACCAARSGCWSHLPSHYQPLARDMADCAGYDYNAATEVCRLLRSLDTLQVRY